MYGDNDNGYHSDNEKNGEEGSPHVGSTESDMLRDLNYDGDIALDEPDYESLRTNRFERNFSAMKQLNGHVANTVTSFVDSFHYPLVEYAAIIIQKHVRRFLAQRQYVRLLVEQFEKEEQIRNQKIKEQVDEAKLLVENHHLEVQFEEYNVVRKNKARRLACYVITIQRAWRDYLSRKYAHHVQKGITCSEDSLMLITTRLAEEAIRQAISELSCES